MNNQFDELTKALAQSVTRRGALKKFGLGLAGALLVSVGLTNKAEAASSTRCYKHCQCACAKTYPRGTPDWDECWQVCARTTCLR